MKKVVAYIDGFNMYHAIDNNLPEYYKWLDYRKLCQHYLAKDEVLSGIFFFTAMPQWDTSQQLRHINYMNVIKNHLSITIIAGRYKTVTRKFNANKQAVTDPVGALVKPKKFVYQTFEEKQTDVNMALFIYEGATLNYYDKALLFTGDSDIAPAVKMVKKRHPEKEFMCIPPFLGKGKVMSGICDSVGIITTPILDKCILPQHLNVNGAKLSCPYRYSIKKP